MYIWIGKGYLRCCSQMIPEGGLLPENVPEEEVKSLLKRNLIRKPTREELSDSKPDDDDLGENTKAELVEIIEKTEIEKIIPDDLEDFREEFRAKFLGTNELNKKSKKDELLAYLDFLNNLEPDNDDSGGE